MDEPARSVASKVVVSEWSRPLEPLSAASGMLVPLFRTATVYKLDLARSNEPRHAIGLRSWDPHNRTGEVKNVALTHPFAKFETEAQLHPRKTSRRVYLTMACGEDRMNEW